MGESIKGVIYLLAMIFPMLHKVRVMFNKIHDFFMGKTLSHGKHRAIHV